MVVDAGWQPTQASGDAPDVDSLRALAAQTPPPADPRLLGAWIAAPIARLDEIVSAQVSEILRHEDFQRLEGTWRGLRFLVDRLPAEPSVKCCVLSVTRRELAHDIDSRADITQSAICEIFAREFEAFLGEPVSTIVADYAFDHVDALLVHALGRLAASLHAVVVAAASPRLFQLDSFADLPRPTDLAKVLMTLEYQAWRALRDSAAASHVVLRCRACWPESRICCTRPMVMSSTSRKPPAPVPVITCGPTQAVRCGGAPGHDVVPHWMVLRMFRRRRRNCRPASRLTPFSRTMGTR